MAEISTTMQAALDYIRQHGGAIERRQGGFWIEPKHEGDYRPGVEYVSPRTVYALEKRGLVEIGYSSKRPRATLTAAGINATNWTPTPGEDSAACGMQGVDLRQCCDGEVPLGAVCKRCGCIATEGSNPPARGVTAFAFCDGCTTRPVCQRTGKCVDGGQSNG